MEVVCTVGELVVVDKTAYLGQGVHVAEHGGDRVQRDAGSRQEMQMDREDDLLQDHQVVGEDEAVDGGRHRPLQRVLERHEALIKRGVGDRGEQILQRGVGNGLHVGQGGHGLVGKRALGPQVPDAVVCHDGMLVRGAIGLQRDSPAKLFEPVR